MKQFQAAVVLAHAAIVTMIALQFSAGSTIKADLPNPPPRQIQALFPAVSSAHIANFAASNVTTAIERDSVCGEDKDDDLADELKYGFHLNGTFRKCLENWLSNSHKTIFLSIIFDRGPPTKSV